MDPLRAPVLALVAALATAAAARHPFAAAREIMVAEQIEARGVRSPAVLAALRRVPRHEFVPETVGAVSYADRPLPIGEGQTISQPYIVALMTELAAAGKGARVLEIGTGSGYQAAVLAELGAVVYSIEIVAPLARTAEEALRRTGYRVHADGRPPGPGGRAGAGPVHLRVGDGYRGWPDAAPFDAVVVTAAPPRIPEPLERQLKVGGRLVIPVGEGRQELRVLRRTATGFEERTVLPVRFVPMTGEAQRR